MVETISASDANRCFSQLLRDVRQGRSFVVTTHGKPVARLVPWTEDNDRAAARAALFARLATQPVSDAEPWTRDELYTR